MTARQAHPCNTVLTAVVGTILAMCASAALSAPALALTAAPGWGVTASALPTDLPPGGSGLIQIYATNVGAASGGATVTDTLPPGVTRTGGECSGTTVVTCGVGAAVGALGKSAFEVNVAHEAPEGTYPVQVTATGGGPASAAGSSDTITISSTPAGFGLAGVDGWLTNADGTLDTQAGSQPYGLTISFFVNSDAGEGGALTAAGELRNLTVNLPPGVVADPNATERECTRRQLDENEACPAASQIGVDTARLQSGSGATELVFPVYNMVPPSGVPAQFGLGLFGIDVFIDGGVRSGGDYGLTGHTDNITQRNILFNTITLWGVPSDPSHDAQRCTFINGEHKCDVPVNTETGLPPFLTMPTSCAGPLTSAVEAVSWGGVSAAAPVPSFESPAITGCDRLVHFNPSISAAPDTSEADTPAGLTVYVRSPQGQNPEGLATSGIKDTKVVLPEGLVINPGQAAGLLACQPAQEGLGGETDEGPPECPASSKVGTVEIETPLLKETLKGNVYVLQSNPPNLQLLLAASAEGVNVKLVGNVHLNEATGQLTTTVDGNPPGYEGTPDVPVSEIKVSFSGGAQAALATPTACGVYTTTSDFTSWASPFIPDVFPASSFAIDSGPGGSPCPSLPLPFSPSMIAGSTTDQAGGFTDFSLLLQNGDDQQRISKLQFKFPPGFSGVLSTVPLCQEPQAAQGTCSPASQIGHTTVASGPGPYPLVIPQPGDPEAPMYLTGPYEGAPFGLSIVTPVIAGPFNLGTIVTRAKIEVDPHTAQITIITDPLPQIIDGIPTDLRTINAVADRPGFMINPTNCNPQEFSGTATSAQGATAPISSHFQVGSCRSLEFTPKFSVSTSGKTSKAAGADLITKLAYPNVPQGSQANIRSVKVSLPKDLPSRLTTLQKACTAKQFATDAAGCPAASVVGHAKVITPVLPVPLTGPAYFVSNGGEAFPNLIVVLQGYGVTVELIGDTLIKNGVTSSSFKSTPDVPFTSFELVLPQGPFSALAANGNLCNEKLVMPTEFVAQNGAEIKQNTKIAVTGCPKVKAKKVTKRHKAKKGHKAKGSAKRVRRVS
jgi:hypothetical protein